MARLVAVVLGYVTLTLVCAAQEVAPAAPAKAEAKPVIGQGRITGTVYCGDTNKPARGAHINLSRSADPGRRNEVNEGATADAEGRYVFDHLRPGDYELTVHMNGYLFENPKPSSEPVKPVKGAPEEPFYAHPTVTVHSTETVAYDVVLARTGALSGRVFFDDGAPAMGATIRVERIRTKGEAPPAKGEPAYETIERGMERGMTDDRGSFRITTLQPGTYRVAAIPNLQLHDYFFEFGLDIDGEDAGELRQPPGLTVFSGDTVHRASAKIYEVRDGDEINDILITIPLANLHRIGGTVSATDGRTPNMGMVTLIDNADDEIHFRTAVRKDGSFTFAGVPSGTYKLEVSHVYIANPDKRWAGNEDDATISANAFATANSSVIVKESDVLDLHFDLKEIPMPVKKADTDDPN